MLWINDVLNNECEQLLRTLLTEQNPIKELAAHHTSFGSKV
jgi:hypothetical protein